MKKKLVIIGITLVLITIGLTGCFESGENESGSTDKSDSTDKIDSNTMVGTWYDTINERGVYIYENGTIYYDNGVFGGNWEIKDGIFYLKNGEEVILTYNIEFSDNNNTCTFDCIEDSINSTVLERVS